MDRDGVPPYTHTSSLPHYSSELLPGERTIESMRRASSRALAGVHRRITDHLTIILRNQHPGSVCPVYGQGESIKGEVILSNTNDLASVILKIEGRFLLNASGVPASATFLSLTRGLWSASRTEGCPRTIPFGFRLPLTFDDNGHARALPPTFESSKPYTACSYSLTIELSRPRRIIPVLKGSEAVKIPLAYYPRSRPHLPILPSDLPFMSTVKCSAEEWREVICTAPMTRGSGLAPVECLLFIPSVQTFALSDIIPFHLQLRGTFASLVPFLEQEGSRQVAPKQRDGGVEIRIYLLRQASVRIHGQSATVYSNLGEGKIEPSQSLHPRYHTLTRHPIWENLDTLDWDGVLQCDQNFTAPSFATTKFSVKDSIVLSITPRQPLKSPLLGVTHSCLVRLVTDPWTNDAGLT